MMFPARGLFVIFLVLLMGSGAAFATPDAPPEGDQANKGKSEETTGTEKKRRPQPKTMPKVTALEELVVIGKIQKPEVFYVLGRSDFQYRGILLKKSFVDRIGKSVRSNPF